MAEEQTAVEPGDELPESLQRTLTRGRRLHKRAMRAAVGTNQRTKLLERSRAEIAIANDEAAAAGVSRSRLPQWSRENP